MAPICVADAASWREVERFLHQSVFESMPLTRLDHEGVLQRSRSLLGTLEPEEHAATVLPWDDPPSFADLQLNIKQTAGGPFRSIIGFPPQRPGWLYLKMFLVAGQMLVTEDPTNTEVLRSSPVERVYRVLTLTRWAVVTDRASSVSSAGAV